MAGRQDDEEVKHVPHCQARSRLRHAPPSYDINAPVQHGDVVPEAPAADVKGFL